MSTLPLFPLGAVLFPGGRLPLQIFEVRYLDMVGRCHREGSRFGVVSLVEGAEVERPGHAGGDHFNMIGTFARIVSFQAPMPGLMRIDCRGEERFRVHSHQQLPHGLWVGEVEALPLDPPVTIPEDLQETARKLGQLIRSLKEQGVPDSEMPLTGPFELEDCSWVANRWAELLPIPAAVKQALLAQDNPVIRLELVGDILDRTTLSF